MNDLEASRVAIPYHDRQAGSDEKLAGFDFPKNFGVAIKRGIFKLGQSNSPQEAEATLTQACLQGLELLGPPLVLDPAPLLIGLQLLPRLLLIDLLLVRLDLHLTQPLLFLQLPALARDLGLLQLLLGLEPLPVGQRTSHQRRRVADAQDAAVEATQPVGYGLLDLG